MGYRQSGLVLSLFASLVTSTVNSQTPNAETELKLGIAAYQKYALQDAIAHLEHVTSLQPEDANGHYYLALANSGMCTDHTWCEKRWSEAAIREYSRVLELDPSHKEALKGMAYLSYYLARFDEAQGYYRRAVAVEPHDAEALFGLGVLDFKTSWQVVMEQKARHGFRPEQSMIHGTMCNKIRDENLPKVAEGIELLESPELREDADAQAYLATLYQERAELQCGDANAYRHDQKLARQLWHRVCKMWSTQGPRPTILPYRVIPSPPPPEDEKVCMFGAVR